MKYLALTLLFLMSMLTQHLVAQSFVKLFPPNQFELEGVLPLSNGDVLLCGNVPGAAGRRSASVMRMDGSGQVRWAQRRQDTTYSSFMAAAELPGGQGYVLGGWCEIVPAYETSVGLVAKMDTSGNFTNLRMLGSLARFDGVSVLPGGDYVLTGGTAGLVASNPPVLARTTPSLQTTQQLKQWAAFSTEGFGKAAVSPDGWVSFASVREVVNTSNPEMVFSRHAPSGNGSFMKYYAIGQYGQGRGVCELASGNHVYFGETTINGVREMILARLDSLGGVIAAKSFHRLPAQLTTLGNGMRLTHPDSLLIWGHGNEVSWLCRADTAGNISWMREYALPNADLHLRDVHQFANGDLLLRAGTSMGSLVARILPNGQSNCPGAPMMGTPIAFVTANISLSASTWGMSAQTAVTDSAAHFQQVPFSAVMADACAPACVDSILALTPQSQPCAGQSGYFCSSSAFSSGFQWTFNGQAAGNTPCASVTYNALGTQDTLTLQSVVNGCTLTHTRIIPVNPIAAGFTSASTELQASFTAASQMGAAQYDWQFGDGGMSTAANPQHAYAQAGTYWVCLTTTSGNCSVTHCDSLTVTCPVPNAAFTNTGAGFNWSFTSGPTGNYPVTYLWDFGDGGTSTAMQPSHAYAAPGSYTVCLTLSSICGSAQTCSTLVATSAAPVASFVGSGQLLNWSFQPAVTGNGPFTYLWDFGDGTTSTQNNPLHHYAQAGAYWVCLTVTDVFGMTSQTCDSVTVLCPLPSVAFSHQITGNIVDFQSQTNGTPGMTYFWDLGDGNTSTAAQVSHSYAASGTYLVCLTVTDSCGAANTCQSVLFDPVATLNALPADWRVWPNPAQDAVHVAAGFAGDMRLLDLQGRVLVEVLGLQLTSQQPYRLALPALPKGIYIMQFQGTGGTVTFKLAVD